jgi:hypothetical protein
MINWHRLFGLALEDYFTGTRYAVEMEKDVARKRQVLDVVIVRGTGEALVDPDLPARGGALSAQRPVGDIQLRGGEGRRRGRGLPLASGRSFPDT